MQEMMLSWGDTGYWAWVIAGLILMLLELLAPGVFLVWMGVGAVATGLFIGFFPEMTASYQFASFAVFSIISVLFGWLVYGKLLSPPLKKKKGKSFKTGETGTVRQEDEPILYVTKKKGK